MYTNRQVSCNFAGTSFPLSFVPSIASSFAIRQGVCCEVVYRELTFIIQLTHKATWSLHNCLHVNRYYMSAVILFCFLFVFLFLVSCPASSLNVMLKRLFLCLCQCALFLLGRVNCAPNTLVLLWHMEGQVKVFIKQRPIFLCGHTPHSVHFRLCFMELVNFFDVQVRC